MGWRSSSDCYDWKPSAGHTISPRRDDSALRPALHKSMNTTMDFPVIELRRYAVQPGTNHHFARYFESYFPEAFQQLGAIVFGHFLERGNPAAFTWLRGFRDMPSRLAVNEAFYSGPLWNEHAGRMNGLLVDHTNVLLLRPLNPEKGVMLLPTVDPVHEQQGAQGVVGAHIFPVNANMVDEFAGQAETVFATYRSAGAREAAVLTTLD